MIQKHIFYSDIMQPKNSKCKKYPRAIYLHLTQRCNFNCVYCYLNAGKQSCNELTTDEVKRILSQIVIFQPVKVIFTGGEPLMRKDLIELARYFRGLNPPLSQLCLDTNGSLITSRTASSLVALFDEIRISIDGFKDTNDVLRGQGAFKSAIQAIGEIHKAEGSPSIAITLTSINIFEVRYFVHYMCHEWGIQTVRINPFKPMGRGETRTDLLLGDHNLNWVGSLDPFSACDVDRSPCNRDGSCIGTSISITPQGLTYPCHWLSQEEYYLGDARNEWLGFIYERLNKLRQHFHVKNIRLKGGTKQNGDT